MSRQSGVYDTRLTDVWSIGQMYDHIIVVAHEYLDEMEACLTNAEHQPLGKTEFG
ncbi:MULTISPECIES: hypothetical protein [unclassified Exiguobacterium]|uniref:hypothetical protein n=1 Tax=unclassified Exiguobacterium TaxID=2644629 RepID=UPI00191BDFB7|nr:MULTISPECIES: hypothetical protein [unclassified Exiguobacterium]